MTDKDNTNGAAKVIVFENELYKIIVGASSLNDTITSDVYKIVNKEYGVVEEETIKLPQAMYMASNLYTEMKKKGWAVALQDEEIAKSKLALPKGVTKLPVQ